MFDLQTVYLLAVFRLETAPVGAPGSVVFGTVPALGAKTGFPIVTGNCSDNLQLLCVGGKQYGSRRDAIHVRGCGSVKLHGSGQETAG